MKSNGVQIISKHTRTLTYCEFRQDFWVNNVFMGIWRIIQLKQPFGINFSIRPKNQSISLLSALDTYYVFRSNLSKQCLFIYLLSVFLFSIVLENTQFTHGVTSLKLSQKKFTYSKVFIANKKNRNKTNLLFSMQKSALRRSIWDVQQYSCYGILLAFSYAALYTFSSLTHSRKSVKVAPNLTFFCIQHSFELEVTNRWLINYWNAIWFDFPLISDFFNKKLNKMHFYCHFY